MITIEDSNIVNWSAHPEYICALVLCVNADTKTPKGVMPKGTEFVWLLDKTPSEDGDSLVINSAKIFCLDKIGCVADGVYKNINPLELHIKPRPVSKIEETKNIAAEV